MSGAVLVAAVFFCFLGGLFFGQTITGWTHPWAPSDAATACERHTGVQQVESVAWALGIDYAAVVVCRDGHVEGLR